MKITLTLLLFIWSIFSSPPKVEGATEFSTTFDSLYTISQSGVTQVTHKIILKNKLAHIYATQYTLVVSGENLNKLVVSDETGSLLPSLEVHNGTTNIHLTIDRPAIGKDQTKTLSIGYESSDIAENIGSTMTINIPRLSQGNEADSYTRTVKVDSLTPPTLIYPSPTRTELSDNSTTYVFVGSPSSALTLLFGESVTYKLNLKYQLKNKELKSIDSELALPPDTPYQRVLLHQITPPPSNIRIDKDGNWLARYFLKTQEKLLVETELYVTVYPKPSLYDPSSHSPFLENPTILGRVHKVQLGSVPPKPSPPQLLSFVRSLLMLLSLCREHSTYLLEKLTAMPILPIPRFVLLPRKLIFSTLGQNSTTQPTILGSKLILPGVILQEESIIFTNSTLVISPSFAMVWSLPIPYLLESTKIL
ncbi:MAG: hypothetical protein UX62_C0027G0010 [Microgenomates group bacterium GW2011_GWA2_46_7]|nr:MAG: hypothetical protein UX62_C0027G0010 [Microgenomates group bacterium GW2011_GWA2_46_7]